MRLKDKIAIVTGGSSGIGAEICKLFSRHGAKVVMVARNKPDKFDGEFFACDVTNQSEVKALFEHVKKSYGRVDILVNNAGITGENLPCDELSYDEFEWVMKVNVGGTFLASKEALKIMKEQNSGIIINIASTLGVVGSPNFGAYAPSKAAVIGMTKQNAINYAKHGIRVNAISPGTVMTELVEGIKNDMGDEAFAQIFDAPHPFGGVGHMEDVAYAALYLASSESKWVTGTNLVVDGGYLAQ